MFSSVAILVAGICNAFAKVHNNVDYVNPLLGTAGAIDIGGYGGMIPSTAVPFAMTRWTAMTQENFVSGCPYIYWQTTFYGFLATHQPAKWMGESGEIAVSFGTGEVKPAFADRGMKFNHSAEHSAASYYSIYVQDANGLDIFAEISGVSRAGILRFTFPNNNKAPYTVIQVTRQGFQGQVTIDPKTHEIYGWNPERQDSNLGPNKAPSFKGYFVARFEEDFTAYGTALNSTLRYNATDGNGEILSAFVQFVTGTEKVNLRMGVSYISIEQARHNLDLEIPQHMSLEDVSAYTAKKWSEKLDQVQLTNATDVQNEIFYTAMFHALQYPNEMMEMTDSGEYAYYSGYDDKVHEGEAYTGYSLWDTFRAEWGFLNLFAPERIDGMIQSMLQVYQQGGRLPMWQNIVETNIMIGTHSASLIAESLGKGFHNFNLSLAWEAVYKDAMVPPDNDTTTTYADRQQGVGYEARAGLTKEFTIGYVAAIQTSEAGSRTLEYAYDDYAVSRVAAMTGHEDQVEYFEQRSKYYRNIFNPETGFMCARNEDGTWNTEGSTWTEGSNWVYTFSVQHDFAGLRDLFNSSENFLAKLDEYFLDHHNLHPNEPSHATAYAYYYANAPDRAQDQLRHILRLNYHAGPFGLTGEDDCGQMSSWYVFNALGFYPVNPASATYMIGSPVFDQVQLHLPQSGHVLTITANDATERKYIQSLTIDGIEVKTPIISHADLMKTKDMAFVMNHQPQTWFKGSL